MSDRVSRGPRPLHIRGAYKAAHDVPSLGQDIDRYAPRSTPHLIVDVDAVRTWNAPTAVDCAVNTGRRTGTRPNGCARLIQVYIGSEHIRSHLPPTVDALQRVEAAAVRRDHEVIPSDFDVRDLQVGQVERDGLPNSTVVEGHVGRVLRAGVQQSCSLGIFFDCTHEVIRADAVHNELPRLAVVLGLEDVGAHVLQFVLLGGQIRLARSMRRHLDQARLGSEWEALGRHILPVRASVPRDMDEPVI